MTHLKDPHFWTAPGYRSLTIRATDDKGAEYSLDINPHQLQRLIEACADAAGQIGTDPPIDWDKFPAQVYWPTVQPWKRPRAADEYHLIDTQAAFSQGGFVSLDAARQRARELGLTSWQIYRGNRRVEQHDPRLSDPPLAPDHNTGAP